ncbi:MAG TPA: PVC-type heme-binding CxxCH protein [Pirellulales bacterium]|jgi:putative heme-binding domain-containing protein|nr:PVC-type heme-binding CxxCH protein [Pirellulales bacterium]
MTLLARLFRRLPQGRQRAIGCALLAFALGASLATARPALAQRDLKDIPDPDPEIERSALELADGFEINLFAADPLLAKPIQISFDPDGRLWVASSETYPQVKPGQQADDKILVLEDADGDGRADKTTIFARGLLIPTGIEPGDGGAYVANSTELIFLKDTDGDGQADARRVMLSGFGTEDTHHILHTFRWGPDGLLYFNQSVYIHSHLETPWGVRRLAAGGIWQLRPETLELEVFARGLVNPWGHAFDRWGQSFATDGAGGQGINYVFPGATFITAQGASRILAGLNPGSPKDCGLEIIDGRHLPDAFQGALLTNDFRAHRVCRYALSEDGSGFASRQQPDLIKTKHVAFRPIDVKQGPDGAIYIADWYNPIIQHGEVDFRDPRRDHTHGRIWRVTAKGRPLATCPKLSSATTGELLAALESPESWTRQFAKRVLKERGDGVLPDVAVWLAELDPHHPDREHRLLEGLWVYQALNVVEPALLNRVLAANDPHARAAAVRVLGAWHAQVPDALAALESRVADEHPRVRLEAVVALTRIGSAKATQVAMRALDKPMDRFLEHALYLAAHNTQAAWLPALEQKEIDFDGDPRHLAFALEAAETAGAVAPLAALVRSGKLPAEQQQGSLALLMRFGGPEELSLVFDEALAAVTNPPRCAELLAGLVKTTRERKLRPAADLTRLTPLLSAADEGVLAAAAQAAGAWQVESLRPKLLQLAAAAQAPDAVRSAALTGLAALGGPASRDALVSLAGSEHPTPARVAAIAALVSLDVDRAAAMATTLLVNPPDKLDLHPLLTALLARKQGPPALTAALKGQTVPGDTAKLALREVRDSGLVDADLIAALQTAGGLKAAVLKLSPDEMKAWVAQVAAEGDAARGEAVFRRAECLKCHSIAGAGGRVGPDLISIGASAQVDYLIESILDPSAKIKENYHSLKVATDDGLVYSGVKVRQSDKDLVLRDVDDREIVIPLDTIDGQPQPGLSLMPVGVADSLTHGELIDVVRFMSELGKVGPYAIDKSRVVRRWQVLPNVPDSFRGVRHGDLDLVVKNDQLKWAPAYSQVSGSLPIDELPFFELSNHTTQSLLRFQLDVTTAGPVELLLPADGIFKLWIDGAARSPAARLPLDLVTGPHTVTLVVEPAKLKSLRIELADVPRSPAQAQIVGGK